jgi:hypothetical protein
MSSVRSPDVRLELRTDCRVVAALLAWLSLTIGCIWWAALPVIAALLLTVVVLLMTLPAVGSQVFVGRRAGSSLVWSGEGRWFFHGVAGTSQGLELSRVRRGFPGGALLVFRAHAPIYWVLLLRRRGDGGAVRRLRVRLNLDSLQAGNPIAGRGSPAGGS